MGAWVRGGHDDATSPKRPGSNDGVLGYFREPPVKQPIDPPTYKAASLQAVGRCSINTRGKILICHR
jgi:hypothetical protein